MQEYSFVQPTHFHSLTAHTRAHTHTRTHTHTHTHTHAHTYCHCLAHTATTLPLPLISSRTSASWEADQSSHAPTHCRCRCLTHPLTLTKSARGARRLTCCASTVSAEHPALGFTMMTAWCTRQRVAHSSCAASSSNHSNLALCGVTMNGRVAEDGGVPWRKVLQSHSLEKERWKRWRCV
jgi:hypothetical protein